MPLKQYLENRFLRDLSTLPFNRPNDIMLTHARNFRIDQQTIYFGGPDWENIENDIQHVEEADREYFFICLFTIVLIDLAMFTYFQQHYGTFRSRTGYPKFGWSGFGPHYENPTKLLLLPEQKGFTNYSYLRQNVNSYVQLFRSKCDSYFRAYNPEITTNTFIDAILKDRDIIHGANDMDSIVYLICQALDASRHN